MESDVVALRCGGLLLIALLLGACEPTFPVNAEDYETSCTTNSDCATVTVGDVCNSCGQELGSINFTVVDAYVVDVVALAENTCALLEDGTIHCWGSNDVGQLGLPVGPGAPAAYAAVPLK